MRPSLILAATLASAGYLDSYSPTAHSSSISSTSSREAHFLPFTNSTAGPELDISKSRSFPTRPYSDTVQLFTTSLPNMLPIPTSHTPTSNFIGTARNSISDVSPSSAMKPLSAGSTHVQSFYTSSSTYKHPPDVSGNSTSLGLNSNSLVSSTINATKTTSSDTIKTISNNVSNLITHVPMTNMAISSQQGTKPLPKYTTTVTRTRTETYYTWCPEINSQPSEQIESTMSIEYRHCPIMAATALDMTTTTITTTKTAITTSLNTVTVTTTATTAPMTTATITTISVIANSSGCSPSKDVQSSCTIRCHYYRLHNMTLPCPSLTVIATNKCSSMSLSSTTLESVHRPLIPIQLRTSPLPTRSGLGSACNHTCSTTATRTSSTSTPIHIMTGNASSIAYSNIALIIAIAMLVL